MITYVYKCNLLYLARLFHYKVVKYCQKSHNNLFNNHVILEGGAKRLYWIIRGEGDFGRPSKWIIYLLNVTLLNYKF